MAFEQTSVGLRPRGQVGQLGRTNTGRHDEVSLEVGGLTAQSYLITVGGATNNATYSITESNLGVTVTYTADGTATVGEIATGLAAAWNGDPIASSLGLATNPAADEVLISFRSTNDGVNVASITLGGSGVANLTGLNTNASAGSLLPYGRLVFRDANGRATVALPGSGNIEDQAVGFSFFDYEHERQGTNAVPGVPPGYLVRCLRTGSVIVADGSNAVYGDIVYVGTGANAGLLFNASGANRSAIPKWAMRWAGPNEVEILLGR